MTDRQTDRQTENSNPSVPYDTFAILIIYNYIQTNYGYKGICRLSSLYYFHQTFTMIYQ